MAHPTLNSDAPPAVPATRGVLLAGGLSALLSTAMLLWRSRVETGSPAAALNAPSQWLWGNEALQHDGVDVKHTLVGTLLHHASALLWGGLFETVQRRHRRRSAASALLDAALVTAVAGVVDLKLVPKRLSPGFEKRLTPRGTAAAYGGFALGMVLAGVWLSKRR